VIVPHVATTASQNVYHSQCSLLMLKAPVGLPSLSDGARTRDLLQSHNPMSSVTVRPTVSGYLAHLQGFRRFRRIRSSVTYQPVLAGLQYGCSKRPSY
jgi:hypothetical protein